MAELVEILANALIRAGLTAADIATPPKYFDFIGTGTGTGKPNTCIVEIKADKSKSPQCDPVTVTCNGKTTTYNVGQCKLNGVNTWTDPNIGAFRLSFGDDSTNEAPFPAEPSLYLSSLSKDDSSLSSSSEFALGQCDLGQGDLEGIFYGTACSSSKQLELKLCTASQTDDFETYTYYVAVPTTGNSYACDTKKGRRSGDGEVEWQAVRFEA